LVATVAACVDRARVNARCEWQDEAPAARGLTEQQLESHLDRDIELATELAVRHADAVHDQRFGVEGHGGLIEGGELRNRCMASLLAAIANTHDVSMDRVAAARVRARRPLAWDVVVIVLFTMVYVGISRMIARAIARRFPAGEGWVALVAHAIAAFGVSACGLQLFDLWAASFEMIRVGNDHLSGYRASWNPWHEHLAVLYVGGILVFLVTAGVQYGCSRGRSEPAGHPV
jgi:hypothetical protein